MARQDDCVFKGDFWLLHELFIREGKGENLGVSLGVYHKDRRL